MTAIAMAHPNVLCRLLPFLLLSITITVSALVSPTQLFRGSLILSPSSPSFSTTKLHASSSLSSSSSPIGIFLSGITGIAPSSLPPPVSILAGTSIDPTRDGVDLGRVYKATKDGWSAINFHNCVDGKGSAIVVALSKSGKLFGGYNPLGWMSSDDYGNSNGAFLWFLQDYNTGTAIKCPILAGGNTAIFDYATGGPNFGAADLCIGPPRAAVLGGFAGPDVVNSSSVAGNLKRGKSSVGGAYDYQKGWPVSGEFQLTELEVWSNVNVGKRSSSTGGGWLGF